MGLVKLGELLSEDIGEGVEEGQDARAAAEEHVVSRRRRAQVQSLAHRALDEVLVVLRKVEQLLRNALSRLGIVLDYQLEILDFIV